MAKNFVDEETIIEAEDANRWESAVEKNTSQDQEISSLKQKDTSIEGRVSVLEGKTKQATKESLGLVKQCALVAEASAENVSKAEFKALLDALKSAGIMASS